MAYGQPPNRVYQSYALMLAARVRGEIAGPQGPRRTIPTTPGRSTANSLLTNRPNSITTFLGGAA